MKRIDLHKIDFEKMKIVENYNYHGEEYHSYHLVFEIPELPNTKLLTVVDVWGNEWNVKRIHQLNPKVTYEVDNTLKENFLAALKKILAIS